MKYLLKISTLLILFFLASCGDKEEDGIFREHAGDLFDDSFVHEIRFNFYDEKGWDSLYVNKKLRDSLELTRYLPVRAIIDSFKIDSAGLRFKGETSFAYTKNNKRSFKVALTRFNKSNSYGKVRTFNLNCGFKDPTMMREKLMLDFLREQKLPAPAAAFVKVFVNDVYLGLYLAVEEIGKSFLDDQFTNHDGDLFLGEPQALLVDLGQDPSAYLRKYKKKNTGTDTTYTALVALITGMNREIKKGKEKKFAAQMDDVMNTEQLLKTWGVCNLFVDPDAFNVLYRHNYALYHEPSSKKWQWITWDHNLAFAAWNPKYTMEEIYALPPDHVEEFEGDHFQKKILGNRILRERYLRFMAELVKGPFSADEMGARINKWAGLIRPSVASDSLKAYSMEDFEKNLTEHLGDPTDPGAYIPGLKAFVIKRRDFIIRELKRLKMFDTEKES